MNIVVCDDDVVRRQALILFLTNSNLSGDLKIYEAQCADEVSELLIARYYDILILDIVIPKRIGEVPLAVNGSALVRKIYKTDRVHKPERIIGITGHLEEIQSYRGNLAKYGVSILEARAYSLGWESSVLNILEYIANSQGQRKKGELLEVITVHGIRTYGEWQARLKKIVLTENPETIFHAYKYGYFSVFGFLTPFIRKREIYSLIKQFQNLFTKNKNSQFVIFCHSFGTYMTIFALEELYRQGYRNVRRVVLCGTVLNSNYDWRFLANNGIEIINDCAQSDLVLWMSQAFVLGTGMAGKTGFIGLENNSLVNRFRTGGHSSYFVGDTFMTEQWSPLVRSDAIPNEFDQRVNKGIMYNFLESSIQRIGVLKKWLYLILVISLVLYVAKLIKI